MTSDKATELAKSLELFASEHRIGYGPITYELHDSDGWLLGSGDSWELALTRAIKKMPAMPNDWRMFA
jgi:hypothetical protein